MTENDENLSREIVKPEFLSEGKPEIHARKSLSKVVFLVMLALGSECK